MFSDLSPPNREGRETVFCCEGEGGRRDKEKGREEGGREGGGGGGVRRSGERRAKGVQRALLTVPF